jgi:hypothetical protein
MLAADHPEVRMWKLAIDCGPPFGGRRWHAERRAATASTSFQGD